MNKANRLRAEADLLEKESKRLLPKHWEFGQRVRFLRDKEYRWSAGSEATIIAVRDDNKDKPAQEFQYFTTSPDHNDEKWWTIPDDVELVEV